MSWDEYSHMFDKAQKVGKYKCYVFDMKDSSKGYDRHKLQDLVIYFKQNLDKGIIHTNDLFPKVPWVVLGDLVVLLTKRDAVRDEVVLKAFKDAKEKSKINKDFHYISGYYETDNYGEGDEKYYLGYCVQELEYRSKQNKQLI